MLVNSGEQRFYDEWVELIQVRWSGRALKRPLWLSVLLLLLLVVPTAQAAPPRTASLQAPTGLTTEHTTSPLDIDVANPRLAWKLTSPQRGAVQTAYQIVVYKLTGLSNWQTVWDSGKVLSANSVGVPYGGSPLVSNSRYIWGVRVWDGNDQPSPWSAPAAGFETGLLTPSDWQAQWIGRVAPPPGNSAQQLPAPLLRKEFTLAQEGIRRARARISGLGYYEFYLNGQRVGDQVLDPGFTVFDRTALYETYDVTTLLTSGTNAMGVELGQGFYGAPSSDQYGWPVSRWNAEPKLLLQLDIEYVNGQTVRVVSDGSWRLADGPTTANYVRTGESYDARLEQPGWASPGFDDSAWVPAPLVSGPTTNLRAQLMEGIKVVGVLEPRSVTQPTPGVYVYDFGRVTTGWTKITVRGPSGTSVSLAHGEKLNQDGTVNATVSFASNGTQTDTYILTGEGTESWEPSFTYHGFRFVQVSGVPAVPEIVSVQAQVVRTAVSIQGSFASSSALFNTLHAGQTTSILNNLHSIPTDTPTYEKAGWAADAHLYADASIYNFGMLKFWEKWLNDFRDSQGADGSVGVIVPTPTSGFGSALVNDPLWSGAYILVAWDLYQYYGDIQALQMHFEPMQRYFSQIEAAIEPDGYLYSGASYGDWLPPVGTGSDTGLVATAMIYHQAQLMAEMARVLGAGEEATHYDEVAENVRAAFNAAFFDPATSVYRSANGPYRQTSNLVALAWGLVPPEHEQAVLESVVADIQARGNHLNTGAIGTKEILPVLTDNGYGDLASAVASQTTYPSWGYWFQKLGASAMWEGWEWTARSRSHAMLGTVDDWFYTHLAGIAPLRAGYEVVRVKPFVPSSGLNWTAAQIQTVRGRVGSLWVRHDQRVGLRVEIPANATGEIWVPTSDPSTVMEGGQPVQQVSGVTFLKFEDGYAVYTVGSGTYSFLSTR